MAHEQDYPPRDDTAPGESPRPPLGTDSEFKSDEYRELFERSADPMTMIVGDRFIDCNKAAVRMLGLNSRADVLRLHPSQISPPMQPDGRDSFEKANEMIAIAFDKGSCRFEWDHVRVDGTPFPVEVLLTVLEVSGQQVLHAVWRDLAERKALEELLRHAQKMEAVGQLAGGIAHDFNNLLVVVQGHADLLSQRLVRDPASIKHLDRIKEAGRRAATLVQKLLAFGRKQEVLPRILDLNAVVLESANLLKPMLSDNIELKITTTDEPVLVKADEGQLEQVLLNLASNARDAMPDGGRLTITITTRDGSVHRSPDMKSLKPGPHAVIKIADTGEGMSDETRERAFDPFYTTKGVGEGTGLGLATVYGIITQSGGAVRLHSAPGKGTTVEIHLPISSEPASEPLSPSVEPPEGGGTETILVVEDEPVVSELIVQVLQSHGYTVLLANDGKQGLELYREHKDSVALILTDVMMPRLSGVGLAKTLSDEPHPPAVLFMSGYTNNALPQLAGLKGHIDLIKKPFDLMELARRIRAAIDRTGNRGRNRPNPG